MLGIGWLALGWFGHDRGFQGRSYGAWNAPSWLRRIVRQGHGPVVLWSLAVEAWGLGSIAIGSAMVIGLVTSERELVAAWVLGGGATFIAALGLIILLIDRSHRT